MFLDIKPLEVYRYEESDFNSTSSMGTLLIAGCGKEQPNSNLLDKNAMVVVNVEDGKSTRVFNPDLPDNPLHLSPRELVEKAENMFVDTDKHKDAQFWLGGILDEKSWLVQHGKRKIGEYQYKLVDEAKFIFCGDFILDTRNPEKPRLEDEFFTQYNVRFVDKEKTIIGYIPNRIIKEGWAKINKAFEAKDYERVYKHLPPHELCKNHRFAPLVLGVA